MISFLFLEIFEHGVEKGHDRWCFYDYCLSFMMILGRGGGGFMLRRFLQRGWGFRFELVVRSKVDFYFWFSREKGKQTLVVAI